MHDSFLLLVTTSVLAMVLKSKSKATENNSSYAVVKVKLYCSADINITQMCAQITSMLTEQINNSIS